MEGINGEYNEHNERPDEPKGGGSFESSGDRPPSDEPDIPLVPTDSSPLDAQPEWLEIHEDSESEDRGEDDPRYTGANLAPAELYNASAGLTSVMDEQIYAVVHPESNDIDNPPEPIDVSQPLDVAQFAPATSLEESQEAMQVLRERAMCTYVQRPEAIQRDLIRVDTANTDTAEFAYDWGATVEYGDDEQGYLDCQYADLRQAYVTFSDPSGSEQKSYQYYAHDMADEGVVVLRRRSLELSEVTDVLTGSLPQAEVMHIAREEQRGAPDIGVEAVEVDPEITYALEDAERRQDPLVGREEIAYLNSRLAAAGPRRMRASGNEFTAIVNNREASPLRPTPIQAAWAARELESTASDLHNLYQEGATHVRGDVKIEVTAQGPTPEAGAFVKVVRREPMTAEKARDVIAAANDDNGDLLPGEADELRYVYRLSSTVSASRDGRVMVNAREVIIDTYTGQPVHRENVRYDHGDIAEVHAIQTIAINPE